MHRVQNAYGDKYSPLTMFDSKRETASLLDEETETLSIREKIKEN